MFTYLFYIRLNLYLIIEFSYSAIGVVTLLSGQPKEGTAIEARAESEGYYEETTSDLSGVYRLRGLLPDTTYVIKVTRKKELGSARIERASPDSISVKVSLLILALQLAKTLCRW